MQPIYGANGSYECTRDLIVPPLETQIEITDAIQLCGMMLDVDPIKGLLVRLMMVDNLQGVQAAIDALADHYDAIDRIQKLSDLVR